MGMLVSMVGGDSGTVRETSPPWNAIPMAAFFDAMFWHAKLGIQVVIEDYVHTRGSEVTLQLLVTFPLHARRDRVAVRDRSHRAAGADDMTPGHAAYKITEHKYDMIVVGAGGAGLRATFGLAQKGLKTACITKVFPTRSHTVAAQGGISAALGNMGADDWRYHFYDTIKGSDWLGDQDAIEYMCREAIPAIIELEHQGVPFSRTEDGKIYQRPFGGMTTEYGKGTAQRTCAAADRTGHAILHTLYQQSLAHDARLLHRILRARPDHGRRRRLPRRAGAGHGRGHAAPVPCARHGAGDRRLRPRVFLRDLGAHLHRRWRRHGAARGPGLQDMEFVQFHPTGIYGAGCLITEGVRGEGGILRNSNGERFMERYAPNAKDLASRDVVSRSMTIEIREGRGVGEHKDHINLDLTHLDPKDIHEKLPGIAESARIFANVDVEKQPIPVIPTVHYNMGGIPTNYHGEVVQLATAIPTRWCRACTRSARRRACRCTAPTGSARTRCSTWWCSAARSPTAAPRRSSRARCTSRCRQRLRSALANLDRLRNANGGTPTAVIRDNMQRTMQADAAVFRTGETLSEACARSATSMRSSPTSRSATVR